VPGAEAPLAGGINGDDMFLLLISPTNYGQRCFTTQLLKLENLAHQGLKPDVFSTNIAA
jgi:hypothetical protein